MDLVQCGLELVDLELMDLLNLDCLNFLLSPCSLYLIFNMSSKKKMQNVIESFLPKNSCSNSAFRISQNSNLNVSGILFDLLLVPLPCYGFLGSNVFLNFFFARILAEYLPLTLNYCQRQPMTLFRIILHC